MTAEIPYRFTADSLQTGRQAFISSISLIRNLSVKRKFGSVDVYDFLGRCRNTDSYQDSQKCKTQNFLHILKITKCKIKIF